MKKLIFVFLILIFIVTACSSAETEVGITKTPTISPTVTQTSTPSITPLPTIPTFTPTFDVSTIITVTPAKKAECPDQNSNLSPNIFTSKANSNEIENLIANILIYLNNGGSTEVLSEELKKVDNNDVAFEHILKNDITNDAIPELILTFQGYVLILYCINQKYEKIFTAYPESVAVFSSVTITVLKDINKNSIPEILTTRNTCGDAICNEIKIYEWDGSKFRSLIKREVDQNGRTVDFTYNDEIILINHNVNGIQRIMGIDRIPANPDTFFYCQPCRETISIYSWNGNYFVEELFYFSIAIYRFQALQDADRYTENGMREKALSFYQDVIFNKDLEWWSPERREFLYTYLYLPKPTPSPKDPISNPAEYPSLASYAYYRIMLIRLVQGQTEEAKQTYQTLQDTFGNDIYAKPYIEMTNAFLEAYQVNQKMYDGCAAAIQYAVEHPEILIPLGSNYHGDQSKIYKPADVCPFR